MPEFDSEAVGFRVASESISPVRRDFETPWLLTPHQGRKVPIAGGHPHAEGRSGASCAVPDHGGSFDARRFDATCLVDHLRTKSERQRGLHSIGDQQLIEEGSVRELNRQIGCLYCQHFHRLMFDADGA